MDQELNLATKNKLFYYNINPHGKATHFCRFRTFSTASSPVVLITELANSGMSVTNSVEKIITQLKEKENIPDNSIFIEHYGPESYSDQKDHPHEFDLVTINEGKPSWQHLSNTKFCNLIGANAN